jgi:DNA helicase-2/ATP-dependent DNA helicase PcrA
VDRIDRNGVHSRWVWTRSGEPGDEDHQKERVMLYALAQQEQTGSDGEITIHYMATGDLRPATPNPKVLARHTAKIDALLEAMQAGQWEPTFGPQCNACPFNLICPV